MGNKTMGNRFESELCELLAQNGFWAHNLTQNQAGQPADVIAVRNNTAALIDCKVCSNNRFPFSRVECNQEGAMTFWGKCGNAECWFALRLSGGDIYMMHFGDMTNLKAFGTVRLTEQDIRKFPSIRQWMEAFA